MQNLAKKELELVWTESNVNYRELKWSMLPYEVSMCLFSRHFHFLNYSVPSTKPEDLAPDHPRQIICLFFFLPLQKNMIFKQPKQLL